MRDKAIIIGRSWTLLPCPYNEPNTAVLSKARSLRWQHMGFATHAGRSPDALRLIVDSIKACVCFEWQTA